MENASKALIIAGAILLAILIIALGVFIFSKAKSATNMDDLSNHEEQPPHTAISSSHGKYCSRPNCISLSVPVEETSFTPPPNSASC